MKFTQNQTQIMQCANIQYINNKYKLLFFDKLQHACGYQGVSCDLNYETRFSDIFVSFLCTK